MVRRMRPTAVSICLCVISPAASAARSRSAPNQPSRCRPKPLPYYFAPRAEKRMAQLEMFRQFGRQVGKTDEEIEQIIQEAMRNGSV